MHGAAARIAASIRHAMKSQHLSGREVAKRIGRLTGRPYHEQYVSRVTGEAADRPLITVSPHLRYLTRVLGLNLAEVISEAIANEDRCPSCGSPDRTVRWKLDHEALGVITCDRQFHSDALCQALSDGMTCNRPIEYVVEGGGEISGWYHIDRDLTARHHALPISAVR